RWGRADIRHLLLGPELALDPNADLLDTLGLLAKNAVAAGGRQGVDVAHSGAPGFNQGGELAAQAVKVGSLLDAPLEALRAPHELLEVSLDANADAGIGEDRVGSALELLALGEEVVGFPQQVRA